MLGSLDHVLVWDLETIPDLAAAARAYGANPSEQALREKLGSFPKLPFHKIVAIGALVARQIDGAWQVRSFGAPHFEERSETDLIAGFVDRVAELRPRMITFNGSSFDLPVLRYRAIINSVSAPGLAFRSYFHRYTDDAVDLCDCLASFNSSGRVTLHELCRALGLPGKLDDIDGSRVAEFVRVGRIAEVAAYCECDVVNTYRLWLRYELFRGALSRAEFEGSEDNLLCYLSEKVGTKPHFQHLVPASRSIVPSSS